MTETEVLDLVSQAAREYQDVEKIDYGLDFPCVARQDGDWYFVMVLAQRRPRRSFEYYGRLREIEHRLRDDVDPDRRLNVLLIPALADLD